MPKRTLSISSTASTIAAQDLRLASNIHVPKFSRVSASPPASPSSPSSPTTKGMADSRSSASNLSQPSAHPIRCLLPPHPPLTLPTLQSFEAHLLSHHTHVCHAFRPSSNELRCGANLPSAHLLALHQAECHDPLVAARREKGEKTFGCLVGGCEFVSKTRGERRGHVVEEHGWRKDWDWKLLERGMVGTSVLKRKGRNIAGSSKLVKGQHVQDERPDKKEMEEDRNQRSQEAPPAKSPRAGTEAHLRRIRGGRNAGFPRRKTSQVAESRESNLTSQPVMYSEDAQGEEEESSDEDETEDEDSEDDDETQSSTASSPSSPAKIAPASSKDRRGPSPVNSVPPSPAVDSVDVLASSMAALKFVPPSVRRNQARKSSLKR